MSQGLIVSSTTMICRICVHIKCEGGISTSSPFPSQASELFDKCRVCCSLVSREPSRHQWHCCCWSASAGWPCEYESQITPIDNLNEFSWWAHVPLQQATSGAKTLVPAMRHRCTVIQLEAAQSATVYPCVRQTQHSTCCKVQDAPAIPHLTTVWVMPKSAKVASSPISALWLRSSIKDSHCIFHLSDICDRSLLSGKNTPYKDLHRQFSIAILLKKIPV